MSGRLRRAWYFWLGEPFWWIFLAFFQPRHFERRLSSHYPQRRRWFSLLFRCIFPAILISYPITLVSWIILVAWHLASPDVSNVLLGVFLWIVFGATGGIAGVVAGGGAGGASGVIIGVIIGAIASGVAVVIAVIIAVIIAVGIVERIAVRIVGGIPIVIAVGIIVGVAVVIAGGMASRMASEVAVGIAFIAGLLRVPFFLVNGPSTFRMYYASRKQPVHVFEYLHRSTLYWDELVFLPLPFLKQTLLLAYDESPERALEEIAFIIAERPRQIRTARATALEIAMRDLETTNWPIAYCVRSRR